MLFSLTSLRTSRTQLGSKSRLPTGWNQASYVPFGPWPTVPRVKPFTRTVTRLPGVTTLGVMVMLPPVGTSLLAVALISL